MTTAPRAMVLAAGLGERMRPLTLARAKPVLPVMNRPLAHWTLDSLARAGVRDVAVNLHHLPATIRRAVGDGRAFGLRVRYSREPTILGTGGGPRQMRAFFGEKAAIVVNGDVLFDFDLRKLLREHIRSGAAATLALLPNPDPTRYSAVSVSRSGWIRSFAGRPAPNEGRAWLFTGVQVIDPSILERLPEGPSHSVQDLYVPLTACGDAVRGVPVEGTWYDFGSPDLYLHSHMSLLASGFRSLRARRRLVHETAEIAPGAVVERSVVGARCVVGRGARVVGSVLWDGVRVGPGAAVDGSILASGVRLKAAERRKDVVAVRAGGKLVERELRS